MHDQTRLLGRDEAFPGFIWAYLFDEIGGSRRLEADDVAAAIVRGEGWVWLHLNLSNARAHEWIGTTDIVPPAARAIFLQADEHQTLAAEDGAIFGIFADLKRDFGQTETEEIAKLRFCLTERLLLSARRTPLRSVEEARQRIEEGQRFPSAVLLLEAVVNRFADGVGEVARGLSDRIDVIEERVVLDTLHDEHAEIGPLRRTGLRLHRQLQHLSVLFHGFADDEDHHLPEDIVDAARRIERRLTALDQDIRGLQERARVLQDELANKLAQQTNRNLYALSVLTAVLVPPTLVTGFFGMNTGGLPWKDGDGGTLWAGLVALASAGIVLVLLRRLGAKR